MKSIPLALAVSLFVSPTAFAQERQANWSAVTHDGGGSAFDCRNCEEDIGIAISCEAGTHAYTVDFLWVAQRDDALGGQSVNVTIGIGNYSDTIQATFAAAGLTGPYPVATLNPDHPFFEFLANRRTLTFSANGVATAISLKGSRDALEKMRAACAR